MDLYARSVQDSHRLRLRNEYTTSLINFENRKKWVRHKPKKLAEKIEYVLSKSALGNSHVLHTKGEIVNPGGCRENFFDGIGTNFFGQFVTRR